MSRTVRYMIGQRGMSILLPLFGERHLPTLSERLARSMSGLFEHLPVEVVQCIVSALFAGDDARASMNGFFCFACTCHGAAAASTRAHRLEAAARAFMGCAFAPLPNAPQHLAYTELLSSYVRADVVNKAMMHMLAQVGTHCAYQSCCRHNREEYNGAHSDQWWRSLGHAGRALVGHAFGVEKPQVRIAIAADKNAHPLCQTDRGVAFIQHGHSDAPKGILCVEDQPCEVYSPDRELKTTFSIPSNEFVALAASSGNIFAFISHEPTSPEDEEFVEPEWAHEVARRAVDKGTLKVWDMQANTCLYAREIDAIVQTLWFVDERVHVLVQDFTDVGNQMWPIYVEEHSPLGNSFRVCSLGNCSSIHDTGVARHTGDLAFLDARLTQRHEHLIFFDARLRQVRTIDSYIRVHPAHDARSILQFSPMGDTLVVLGQAHEHRSVLVYYRSRTPSSRWQTTRQLGWTVCAQVSANTETSMQFTKHRDYPFQHSVASPCGSKMLFFFKSSESAEVVTVRVRFRLEGEPKVVRDQFFHKTVPQDQVVWTDNGLYLPTGHGGGILRIGA